MPANRYDNSARTTTIRKEDALMVFGCFSLYILAKPFYIFPSGLPQLADLLIPFIVVLYLVLSNWVIELPRRYFGLVLYGTAFVLYAVIVNGVVALSTLDFRTLKSPIFYLFNFVVFLLFLRIGSQYGRRPYKIIAYAILASFLLQSSLSLFSLDTAVQRQTLFFNNPNQLGYWTVLSMSMFLLCAGRGSIPSMFQALAWIPALYLVSLSLSKAAILSIAPLFVIQLAHLSIRKAMICLVIVGVSVGIGLTQVEVFQKAVERIESIGDQPDDRFSARGYERIIRFPEYLFFGAGEGSLARFDLDPTRELHSTLGTVFFSYGFLGSFFFFMFVMGIYRNSDRYDFLFLLPAFLYGFTHQGLRATMVWLLAAIIASNMEPKTCERQQLMPPVGSIQ